MYATSLMLTECGVIQGDMTNEAAITKLMMLLGETDDQGLIRQKLTKSQGRVDNSLTSPFRRTYHSVIPFEKLKCYNWINPFLYSLQTVQDSLLLDQLRGSFCFYR